jgi:hypothetical protein
VEFYAKNLYQRELRRREQNMIEYRKLLVGGKKIVGPRKIMPVSDWTVLEIYDNAGNFLGRFLTQYIPRMERFINTTSYPSLQDYCGKVQTGTFTEGCGAEINEVQLLSRIEEVDDTEAPFTGVSGYFPNEM